MDITQIWIDADSCPLPVRNYCIESANKNKLKIFLVANKEIKCTVSFPYQMIVVSKEKDSADNYILSNAKQNDLVITRDIVFADKLNKNNIACINDRGTEFTAEKIKKLLEDREFDLQIANCGLVKHFHEGYDNKKFQDFKNCFNKVLTTQLRQE